IKPHPLLAATGLPLDEHGRLQCTAALRVAGTEHAWAAGDAASVPDLTADSADAKCAHNAQHAVRQARVLADNVLASLRGDALTLYAHSSLGAVATLGLHQGVAYV